MASHHHAHHCHHPPNPTITTTTTAGCSCNCSCLNTPSPNSHSQSSPPLQPLDPLLHALISQLLLQHPQPPQNHSYASSSPPPPPPYLNLETLQGQQQASHTNLNFQLPKQPQDRHTHSLLSSLLHRIDSLESSFQHLSSSSSSTSSYKYRSLSLRDTAARVIQIHFRAYLVHRSRSLRHLKDLNQIKTSFNTLKSSLSELTHLDPDPIYHEVMDLLLKIDSIQDSDLMVKDTKRLLSRDLIGFLEFLNGISVKRHELLAKAMRNARCVQNVKSSRYLGTNRGGLAGDRRVIIEKLRRQIENDEEEVELEGFCHLNDDDDEIPEVSDHGRSGASHVRNGVLVKRHGGQTRVKKSVNFVEDENEPWGFTDIHKPTSGQNGASIGNQSELLENLNRKVEEMESLCQQAEGDEDEEHTESGGSSLNSEGENPKRNLRDDANYIALGHNHQGNHEHIAFSAPEQVKMESRADLMKRKERLRP